VCVIRPVVLTTGQGVKARFGRVTKKCFHVMEKRRTNNGKYAMKKINDHIGPGCIESTLLFEGRVPSVASGQRLDAFLAEAVAGQGISRGKVQDLIREGLATLNGKPATKPNLRLGGGEMAVLTGIIRPTELSAGESGVRVLWCDSSLAVVDKPAGLTTHPAPGLDEETLVHRLLHDFPELSSQEGERPGIVHRLDKDTSGLILAALTERARLKLSEAFAARTTGKVYLALTHGVPKPPSGTIDAPVGRDPGSRTRMAVLHKGGREALSNYAVLWSSPDKRCALVAVRIHTGRTHQIRVHLTHLGHPLWGDAVYGPRQYAEIRRADPVLAKLAPRQMLHAFAIRFPHPDDDRAMRFFTPPHKDFKRLPLHLARRVQRVAVVGLPGSGKSAFCAQLAERGVPVFSADAAVAAEYAPGANGWLLLRGRFGDRFIPGDNAPLDRRALFEAMRVEPAAPSRPLLDRARPRPPGRGRDPPLPRKRLARRGRRRALRQRLARNPPSPPRSARRPPRDRRLAGKLAVGRRGQAKSLRRHRAQRRRPDRPQRRSRPRPRRIAHPAPRQGPLPAQHARRLLARRKRRLPA